MKRKSRNKRKKRRDRFLWMKRLAVLTIAGIAALAVTAMFMGKHDQKEAGKTKEAREPQELLIQYMNYIPEQKYEEMYQMLNLEEYGRISQEDFIKRNRAIYEGMEVKNLETEIISYQKERETVTYQTSFDTIGGRICFENEAFFLKGENGYELVWDDSMIFPELGFTDKVKVSTIQAERGEILDRNGRVLAGKGTASSVGVVLGKLENREEAVGQMAVLLEMEPEAIEKKLSVSWAKEDSFIPIQTIPKLKEAELMVYEKSGVERVELEPDEKLLAEKERQEKLLEIPGVMLADTQVREYPLGKAAAHLTGYVQNVTAEDLEAHPGEGYTAASVIGKSGAEGLFEKELRGRNGCRIYIADSAGREKKVLADQAVQHGQNIRLTIDADLQTALYEQFQEDKSCSVAMNPYTGEVLALVSTPSYDSNDFIMGYSKEQWAALNEDEKKPMYNRFRQTWCPGSVFKPVTAAIGLESGAVDPLEDYGEEGLRWQKDGSWGSYYVTTLHAYRPVILENALIYSDNIYFAKAALKIGAEKMSSSLSELGFQKELPFEILMTKSQYSNTEFIETEIQLADSGYGQGQILINPLHMACIYSAFCNEGNMIKPYLTYSEEKSVDYWIPGAFSKETADQILEGTKKVVSDPNGTGYRARREEVVLAGKTGTAEIKASQNDDSGTELGWFVVYTPERNEERPILLVSMVEDVKERGGSGYVVEKENLVLGKWFHK
ncbi:MAG: penicillin-binding transpeptidase domain-containing protein [Lachnospiraceae bacterium]|nr:penicillin-binding transpeptidase domain-containing protein [Lachnospiraceae bacterium]